MHKLTRFGRLAYPWTVQHEETVVSLEPRVLQYSGVFKFHLVRARVCRSLVPARCRPVSGRRGVLPSASFGGRDEGLADAPPLRGDAGFRAPVAGGPWA